MPDYTLNMKSKEKRGASQVNTLRVNAADDDDADAARTNMEVLLAGDVITVNKFLMKDYTLPYPEGTGRHLRGAMWTAPEIGETAQMRIQNVKLATSGKTLADALVAAGIKLPKGDEPDAAVVNFYDITPGRSV